MSLLLKGLSKEFMKEVSTRSREVYEMMLPPVDMFEDGTDLVIMLDMPGYDKTKIKTRLHEHSIVVSAKRDKPEHDGVTYWEQRPLSIHKRIALPVKVRAGDEDTEEAAGQVSAKYVDGVLTIRLPMKDVGRIPVQ